MIEVLPQSREDVLVLRASDRLTHRDYTDVLAPRLERIFREHGKARVLVDIGEDFHGWEPAALWDDTRLGVAHWRDFTKMGVIGGPGWAERLLKAFSWTVRGEVRSFSPGQRDEAIDWVHTPATLRPGVYETAMTKYRSAPSWQRGLLVGGGVLGLLLVALGLRRSGKD